MHLNLCVMIGRVSAKGPALRYSETGVPFCSFVLEVDEITQGKTYTTFVPCEITGKYAEQTSVDVEAGDVLQISGKWKYKSSVDPKTGVKVSKPVVSSWGISQREATSPSSEYDAKGSAVEINLSQSGASEPGPGTKARKRAVPKHLQREWQPQHAN